MKASASHRVFIFTARARCMQRLSPPHYKYMYESGPASLLFAGEWIFSFPCISHLLVEISLHSKGDFTLKIYWFQGTFYFVPTNILTINFCLFYWYITQCRIALHKVALHWGRPASDSIWQKRWPFRFSFVCKLCTNKPTPETIHAGQVWRPYGLGCEAMNT